MRQHPREDPCPLLPLAERVLTGADWEAIDAAFKANDDPLFGPQPGEEFRALFQRIVTRAPAPIGVGAPAPPKR